MRNAVNYESGFIDDWWDPSTWFQNETVVQQNPNNQQTSLNNEWEFADKWVTSLVNWIGKPKAKTEAVNQYNQAPNDAVTVFADPDFAGRMMSMKAGVYDINQLKGASLDDSITSIKIPPGFTVELFEHPLTSMDSNKKVVLTESNPNIKIDGRYAYMNDRTSAIKVYGSWNGLPDTYSVPNEVVNQDQLQSNDSIVPVIVGSVAGIVLIYGLYKVLK